MKARTPAARARRRRVRRLTPRRAVLISEAQQLAEIRKRNAAALKLLDEWLADESGYDERVWPKLKQALEEERRASGERSLFDE